MSHLLSEEEVLQHFTFFVENSIGYTRNRGLNPSAEHSGPALCLYYAALRSSTAPPSVLLSNHSGSATERRLSPSTCPTKYVSFVQRWANLVPRIQMLTPEQRASLEEIACDSTPVHSIPLYSTMGDLGELSGSLLSLASDIARCQHNRLTSGVPSYPSSAMPEPQTSQYSDPNFQPGFRFNMSPQVSLAAFPDGTRYANSFHTVPEPDPSFRVDRHPINTHILPTHETTRSPVYGGWMHTSPNASSSSLGDNTPTPLLMPESHNARNAFIGGLVAHGRRATTPAANPYEMPAASPYLPTRRSPNLRASTVGNDHNDLLDVNDATSSTDIITTIIGSGMPIWDIIERLNKRGCTDLSAQLNLDFCEPHPRSGGGCSHIYCGRLYDGTQVAIKTLFRQGSNNQEEKHLKRAARELNTWSKCKHPHVAQLLGLAEFRGHLAMISYWMNHGDLPEYLVANPHADRLAICIQVADALTYLHSIGVVHGDLKGANVLISDQGTAVLIDFGNALFDDIDLQFTHTSTVQFTARWTAPEVGDECQHSVAGDVYSLGMTILEAFTGKIPYSNLKNRAAQRAIMLNEVPERPLVVFPMYDEWSDRLWNLLLQCWHREPENRPTARQVREQLKAQHHTSRPFGTYSLF